MSRRRLNSMAALSVVAMLALSACGSDDDADELTAPEESPQTQDEQPDEDSEEVRPPGGGFTQAPRADPEEQDDPALDDEDDEGSEDEDEDSADEDEEFDGPSDPDPREEVDEDAEDPIDEAGAREARQRAEQVSEEADESFSEYAVPDDVDELNALGEDWWNEREEKISTRVAEIMTSYDPVNDFNRDEAMFRANHLLSEGSQITEFSDYPALDDSWASAAECDAEVEVYTEYREPEGENPAMNSEVVAEYRWTDGDDDCELIQPNYYYVYEISIDDAGLASADRHRVDDALGERASGWDMD